MTEFLTKNTVSATFWCKVCREAREHHVLGGRKAGCKVCEISAGGREGGARRDTSAGGADGVVWEGGMTVSPIVITESDRQRAFALFDQGEPVGRVATLLFGAHWYKAKKLRDEYDAQKQPAAEPLKGEPEAALTTQPPQQIATDVVCEAGKAIEPVEDPPAEEWPETWDVTLQVSAERMDRILLGFSPQEKADAICGVLQARLNAEG